MSSDPNPDKTILRTSRGPTRGWYFYLCLSIAISFIIAAYFIATGKALAFDDIGLDTISYFYPLQIIQSQQLRMYHALTWSFQLGLGGYIGAVVNPVQFAFAWLPDDWQLGARLPMYLFKLVAAGAFFFGYLRRLRFDAKLACIGALSYAFGNYGIINEQWDALFILQFSAYLYFFESHFRTGKAWFAVAAGVTVCAAGPFELYVFALLTALYLPARTLLLVHDDDARPLLPSILTFGLFAALGSLLMAFIQLPNILYLLDSPRVSGDHAKFSSVLDKVLSLNSRRTIGAELAGLFGKDLLGTASRYQGYANYFEAPGFYGGLLMLVCWPQLLAPEATRKERASCIIATALLTAYIALPAMRHAVYGFGHTGFRISTLWVSAGIVVIGLAGLRRASETGVWRPGLVIAAAVIFLCLAVVGWRMHHWIKTSHLVLVVVFTCLYLAILWIRGRQPATPAFITALCFTVAFELLVFAAPAFVERRAIDIDGTGYRGSYQDGTGEAIAFAHRQDGSDEFYRMEKTYESVFLNDALVQGYYGTKSYFFHGKSITRFVDQLKLKRYRPRPNYISAMTDRPALLNLLGVRYILDRDGKLENMRSMEYVGSTHGIRVYRNTKARGIGEIYHMVKPEAALVGIPPKKRDAHLLRSLFVEDADAVTSRMRELERASAVRPRPRADQVRTRLVDDTHLQMDVEASRTAALLVTMPFERGWAATINGEPIGLFRAQYGLTAMIVPAGSHDVELRYQVPGRRLGFWISGGALLLLLAAAAWRSSAGRRRTAPRPASSAARAP